MASLFLKRHISTKIDLIVPDVANFGHKKQNSKRLKVKIKEFEINLKVAVRNYTSVVKWKISGITARKRKLNYTVHIWFEYLEKAFV